MLLLLQPVSLSPNDFLALFYHVAIQLREQRNVQQHAHNQEPVETKAHVESIRELQVPLLLGLDHWQGRKEQQHLPNHPKGVQTIKESISAAKQRIK